jgi:hypothetical protein
LPEFRAQLPIGLQTEMKVFMEDARSAKKVESTIKLEKRREKGREAEREKELVGTSATPTATIKTVKSENTKPASDKKPRPSSKKLPSTPAAVLENAKSELVELASNKKARSTSKKSPVGK